MKDHSKTDVSSFIPKRNEVEPIVNKPESEIRAKGIASFQESKDALL